MSTLEFFFIPSDIILNPKIYCQPCFLIYTIFLNLLLLFFSSLSLLQISSIFVSIYLSPANHPIQGARRRVIGNNSIGTGPAGVLLTQPRVKQTILPWDTTYSRLSRLWYWNSKCCVPSVYVSLGYNYFFYFLCILYSRVLVVFTERHFLRTIFQKSL